MISVTENQNAQKSEDVSLQSFTDESEDICKQSIIDKPIVLSPRIRNSRLSFDTLCEVVNSAYNNSSHDLPPLRPVPSAVSSSSTSCDLELLGTLAVFTQNHIGSIRPQSPDINQNYNGPKAEYFSSEDYIPMRKASRESSTARDDYPVGSVFKIGTGLNNMGAMELETRAKLAELSRQYKEKQKLFNKLQPKKE